MLIKITNNFLLIILIVSCTRTKNMSTQQVPFITFEDRFTKEQFIISSSMELEYKSCSFLDKNRLNDYFRPLTDSFYKRFGITLKGISDVQIEGIQILDSSLFVPNEQCRVFKGKAITREPLPSSNNSGFLQIQDKRNHVH